jgi:branched-chain amino acid transport system permease protein
MEQIIQILLNCLVLSANYILLAVGLTLIFGILTTLNFSHGVLYIVGAYFVYTFINILGVHYLLAMVMTAILVAGLGLLFEGLIFYPLKDQHFLSPIGAIMGVGMIIEGALAFIYMGDDVSIGSFFKGVVPIAGATVSLERIIVVGVCALVMLGVYIWIRKTKQGSAIRCLAEN